MPLARLHPVAHNESEAILVRMFDPRRHRLEDWRRSGAGAGVGGGVAVEQIFHSVRCSWNGGKPVELTLAREVQIDAGSYDHLALCVQSLRSTTITVRATVDGVARVVVDAAAGNDAGQELEGPLGGSHITALEIELADPGAGPGSAELFWLGLFDQRTRQQRRQLQLSRPYPQDWADLLIATDVPVAEPTPQLGMFFGADELERLRARAAGPTWGGVYAGLRALARGYADSTPWRGIGHTVNNYPVRNGHRSDGLNAAHNWIDLTAMRVCALVGLIDRDQSLLRVALHHALAAAHCDVWTPGFMSTMPGSSWETRAFSEYRYAINTIFAWDWAGSLLTPAGKELLAQAVSVKALPWIQQTLMRHPYVRGNNQGIFFAFGGIVVSIALGKHWPYGDEFLEPFRAALDQTVIAYYAADGGTFEGVGYASGALEQALAGYALYARYREIGLEHVVPEAAVRVVDYLTAMLSTEAPIGSVVKHSDGGRAGVCVRSGALGLLCRLSKDAALPALLAGLNQEPQKPVYCPEHELNLIWGPDELPEPAATPPQFRNLEHTGLLCSLRHVDAPDDGSAGGGGRVRVQLIGGPAGAGHGHDDRGSFVLEAFDEELAVDRGQMPYVDPRSSTIKLARYHNLAIPHDAQGVPMRQHNPCPVASVARGHGDAAQLYCSMDLDGVWPAPVTGCARELRSDDPRRLSVVDRLHASEPLAVGLYLHSRFPWRREKAGWVTEGERARLLVAAGWTPAEQSGVEDFVLGSGAPAYRLLLLSAPAQEHELVTELAVERRQHAR